MHFWRDKIGNGIALSHVHNAFLLAVWALFGVPVAKVNYGSYRFVQIMMK